VIGIAQDGVAVEEEEAAAEEESLRK